MGQGLDDQIRASFRQLADAPEFAGERLWLTMYLCGEPAGLRLLAEALSAEGWQNVDGSEGAFIYPKREVAKTSGAILEAAKAAQALCRRHRVEMLNIDADTSLDVHQSRFMTIYRSGG
jgi:hypothetical protein